MSADGSNDDVSLTNGVWDSVYNWGTSWMNYAQSQFSNLLGTEDLEVVNPESNEAQKAGDLVNPDDKRQQMWSNLEQYIGHDVMSLMSVPVWIMEPFTVLQKMAEIMEYTDLLDKANSATEPMLRLAYVTAFAITPYGAIERPWKPFNPILGETFELECGNQVRFLAEQVSHHPPIAAAHAENEHFIYDIVSAPKTKFLGNSAEIYPCGRSRIQLKSTGETFAIIPPTSKVCNLIIGRTWVDTFGPMTVINVTTGDKCELDFTPCGWFGTGRYEFNGILKSATKSGAHVGNIAGLWNEYCNVEFDDRTEMESMELWKCAEKPEDDVYGRTYFCYKCSSCSEIMEPLMTDSRRRPDVHALDKGDNSTAASWKHRLEEMQRAEKRKRVEQGDSWAPKWFTQITEESTVDGEYSLQEVPAFQWTGEFFNRELGKAVEQPESVSGVGFLPWKYPEIHNNEQTS
eukprot:g8236.t1